MSKTMNQAFVTLATNDNYAIGALTLAASLKKVQTTRSLCVLITNDLSDAMRNALQQTFDHIELIEKLDSGDASNLELLKRPELGVTFTKIHCWKLTQYDKCVFLDADCLVLRNVDDLFERDELSAAADVGWPDCFNSGVFVYKPSLHTYTLILDFASKQGSSFDGGDQGLLNSYFKEWSTSDASKRLPFVYNMTTNVSYTYAPAFKNDQVKCVHFIGAKKPWYYTYDAAQQRVINTNGSGSGGGTSASDKSFEEVYLNQWWSLFAQMIYPLIGDDFKDKLRTQYINAPINAQETSTNESIQSITHSSSSQSHTHTGTHRLHLEPAVVIGSPEHRHLWEQGKIDFNGRDSFSNIQAHMDAKLNGNSNSSKK